MRDYPQRRLFSAICHGAIFFSSTIVSIAIPIAILFTNEDPVVKANAKESLNFHITLYRTHLTSLQLSSKVLISGESNRYELFQQPY
jgi:hypothetical protein